MDTTSHFISEHLIPETNLPTLREAIEKLGKKASRLGLPTIAISTGTPKDVAFVSTDADKRYYSKWDEKEHGSLTQWEQKGRVRYVRYIPATIEGQKPHLGGWNFVATLQHMEGDGGEHVNMLRTVPGFEGQLPKEYRTASPEHCDHCNRRIASRKETFIVQHESGAWKQVGRNCTQDFLGGLDPHLVAKQLEMILSACSAASSAEEGGFGGGGGLFRYSMMEFLGVVSMLVRKEGWISRGRARQLEGVESTASAALRYLGPPPHDYKARAQHFAWIDANPVEQQDQDVAAKAFAYAREDLADKDRNDYEHNLYVACMQSSVDDRIAGITASLISYYVREIERQTLKEVELRKTATSTFVGTEKERLTLQVTVLKIITCEGSFGTSLLHRMITSDGNVVVWFATGSTDGLSVGTTAFVKATVKKHEERSCVKQTCLTRVVVMTAEEVAKEQAKADRAAVRAAKKAAKGVSS